MTEFRICKICGIEKELEEFPKHKNNRGNRLPQCKTCYSAAARARYAADPKLRSKLRAYQRNHYATNPEHRKQIKENSKAWQQDGRLTSLKKTRAVFHDDDKIRGAKIGS